MGSPPEVASTFMPIIGESTHERLNFGTKKELDFCFCEDSCDDSGFFKVGEMTVVPFRPVPSINKTYPSHTESAEQSTSTHIDRPLD